MLRWLGEKLIAQKPNTGAIWFDYTRPGPDPGTVLARGIGDQAVMLKSVGELARTLAPQAGLIFIGHSLGSMVATKSGISFSKAVLLAPPAAAPYFKFLNRFQLREGTVIDMEGISRLPGSDGISTWVPASFWSDLLQVAPYAEVQKLATSSLFGVGIVRATQDSVIGTDPTPYLALAKIGGVTLQSVQADHDFDGQFDTLADKVAGILGW
jgi:hypothetical protein